MPLSEDNQKPAEQPVLNKAHDVLKQTGALEKMAIRRLCRDIKSGALEIEFWDGITEKYGIGVPLFKLIITSKGIIGRLIKNPALVFGEAYVDGEILLEGKLEDVICLLHQNKHLIEKYNNGKAGQKVTSILRNSSIARQKKSVRYHYDLGNDFFSLWLDPTMSYSCAYFHSATDTLENAQLQKIDHILKKLQLKPGQTLLDIGSGWGWLIIRAAQKYGVKSTGITVSKEQYEKTSHLIKEMQLSRQVSVLLADYRELANGGGKYDRIVSVGMFEHVGRSGLSVYMRSVADMLKPGGLSLLHTITHLTEEAVNPWIEKYIFPGGYIPSLRETIWFLPNYDFHLLDVESLREHYALTLDNWSQNFENHLEKIKQLYDERFIRMWRMYLQSSAASFRYSGLSVHQLLFSKGIANDLRLTRAKAQI